MRRALALLVALSAAGLVLLGCSADTPPSPVGHYRVGVITENFLDSSRVTPAHGYVGARAGRLLVTTVLYPALGAPTGAPENHASPDRADGPYPLVVFAHGFGANPAVYSAILDSWASAGYVVAAPRFPLTSNSAAGGLDLADYVNQPADMSFVITQVLKASAASTGTLAGLVDPSRIGAAGHSLGGVTTLGLVANTCCMDSRVKAAVVMSGDAISFPTGQPDFAEAPPLLLVHGDADGTVPYESSVYAFDEAHTPKGLLTIEGGDHGSTVLPGDAFSTVADVTTEFFDRYLKGYGPALSAMEQDGSSPHTKFVFAARSADRVVLPTVPTTPTNLRAQVSPDTRLHDGQSVTISWEGYKPGTSIDVVECSRNPPRGADDCDLSSGSFVSISNTDGAGSTSFVVLAGPIGSGTCGPGQSGCVIVVDQGGSSDPAASVTVPISFGP